MPELKSLPLNVVVPDPNQPRKYYDELAMNELVQSIATDGVIQPILVRPIGDQYMIVCGERRYRASQLAGKKDIPAVIRHLQDDEALQLQIVENLLRKDVHPIEEAVAFKSLSDKYSIEEIATRVGKSPGYVAKRVKLNDLVPDGQFIYWHNMIDMKLAQMLARLTPEDQQAAIDESSDRKAKSKEIEAVSEWRLKSLCQSTMVSLDRAIFKTNDAKLYPEAGACTKCPFNSANQPLLFDDEKGRKCSKPACFKIKTVRAEQAKLQEVAANPNIIVVADSSYFTEEEKLKLKAAEEVGLSLLDRKLWDKDYGAPEDEFDSFEKFLEDQYFEDEEPTEAELAEANKEYDEQKADWEKERKEYEQAVAAGNILQAYDVLTGKMIPIKLHKEAAAIAKSATDGTGDSAIQSEILKIELREQRAKELDRCKIFGAAAEYYKEFAPDFSVGLEGKLVMIVLLLDQNFDVRRFLSKELQEDSDWGWYTYYLKLIELDGYHLDRLYAQVISVYIRSQIPAKDFHDFEKYGKAAAYMNFFERMFKYKVDEISAEVATKAEKRIGNVQKRIDALKAKLTPVAEPAEEPAPEEKPKRRSKKKPVEE